MTDSFTHPGRPARKPETKASRTLTLSLATLATFATLAAIILSLLGYGFALAVESTFGIPHAQLYSSSTDLLGLSTFAILEIFNVPFKSYWLEGLASQWKTALLIGLLGMLTWAVLAWRETRSAPNTSKRRRSDKEVRVIMLSLTPVAGMVGFAALYVLRAAMILAIYVVIALLAMTPSVGLTSGKKFLDEYVIQPKACAPVLSRDVRLVPLPKSSVPGDTRVTCLEITDLNEKPIAAGRLVVATTGSVVLFDPKSGSAERIPTQGLIVRPISILQ